MSSDTPARPYIRPDVEALPAYVPGARADDGRAAKLSSNENPNPASAAVRAAIAAAAGAVNRYPDMHATALVEALAAHYGCGPDNVACGTGSVALLAHALTAVCPAGAEVIYPWRSFEAYPIIAQTVGAASVIVPLTASYGLDLPAMAAAVTDATRAIIVCTPNNPTGTILGGAEIEAFLRAVPDRVAVFLDEAYAEYAPAGAGFDLARLERFPNLLVFRTFSKAYALAGLRVGYALGSARLIAAVRATSTPFGVNAVAQAAAIAALGEGEAMRAQVAATVRERDRVVGELRRTGWAIPATHANFFYLPLGPGAEDFAADAAAAGLLVRPFAGDGVRVSISSPEDNDRLLAFMAGRRPR